VTFRKPVATSMPPEVWRHALARCDAATRELQALIEILSECGPALPYSHTALARVTRLRRKLEELK